MLKIRALFFYNSLILTLFWVFIQASKGTWSVPGNLFIFLVALFMVIFSLSLLLHVFRNYTGRFLKTPIILTLFALLALGLGTLLQICCSSPSLSLLFYLLNFQLSFAGWLIFMDNLSNLSEMLLKSLIGGLILSILVLLSAKLYFDGVFSLYAFSAFYLPMNSFALLVISFITFVKAKKVSLQALYFVVLGFAFWFIADSLRFHEALNHPFMGINFSELLYLIGASLKLYGILSLLDSTTTYDFTTPAGNIYYQRIPTYIPINLNKLLLPFTFFF